MSETSQDAQSRNSSASVVKPDETIAKIVSKSAKSGSIDPTIKNSKGLFLLKYLLFKNRVITIFIILSAQLKSADHNDTGATTAAKLMKLVSSKDWMALVSCCSDSNHDEKDVESLSELLLILANYHLFGRCDANVIAELGKLCINCKSAVKSKSNRIALRVIRIVQSRQWHVLHCC
jgi:hypothetical protein